MAEANYQFTATKRKIKKLEFDHIVSVCHVTQDPHQWDAKVEFDLFGSPRKFLGAGETREEAIRDLQKQVKANGFA